MADEFLDLGISVEVCASIYISHVQDHVEVMEVKYIYEKMQRKGEGAGKCFFLFFPLKIYIN